VVRPNTTAATRTNRTNKDVIVSVYRKLAAAGVLVVGLALPLGTGVASAQQCRVDDDYCNPDTPEVDSSDEEVLPEEIVAKPAQAEIPEEAAVPASQEAPSGSLPLTGGDVVGMSIIGAGAIAVGTVLVRRSKRSGAAAA
jgi:LPXTG-motif cell wall-anchored protein